jgi:tRNA threonylcarbamoyladenosine biosynthesis protein TsaB
VKILAVDTALGACSAAVLDGEKVLAHRFELMERGHAEALAPMVEQLMAESGIAFAALDRLAVTTGPGTFTGQRVGLAFMRGLRIALKKPLVGITTLAAMAHQAMAETGAAQGAALHDARRDEVYVEMSPGIAPSLVARGEAAESVARAAAGGRLALAGTAAPDFLAALRVRKIDAALSSVRHPDALWVARLALAAPEPEGPPRPLYLRAPDARLPPAASG